MMSATIASPRAENFSYRPAPVPEIVEQHLEDALMLHATRTALTSAPHAKLLQLRRFDDRLAAHLDGLSIAGECAWAGCEAALESPSASALFLATVRSIEDQRDDRLERLLTLAQSLPECRGGLTAAFGWLERDKLRGVVARLLGSTDTDRRLAGIAASSVHRVDPGIVGARRLEDPDPAVRARSLRAAGELGKHDLVSTIAAAVGDADPACQFWAAWSAVLLGDRGTALEYLQALAMTDGLLQPRAFQLALQAISSVQARALLQQISKDQTHVRKLIHGAGLSGDPTYVPWLIGHMADDKLARLAGEAFSMITGADLALLDLERNPPETIEAGPNDDPEDDNVDMDADEDLPWCDQKLVQAWWTQHGPRFTQGVRHFCGAPITREHCVDVLKNGYQRQRIVAAYHLCLLNPGTPLFEWRAPAWRQQRELAQLA